MAGELEMAMGIANLLITGAQAFASYGNTTDQELTLEQIALQREEAEQNRNALEAYLAGDWRTAVELSRTTFEKQYDDIYSNLQQQWGGQSVSFAAADQEAAAGTSTRATLGRTRAEIEYQFGDDLQKDMNGGLYALAKTNMENEIATTEQNMQTQIDSLNRAIGFYDKASGIIEHEMNETPGEKAKEGWDKFWSDIGTDIQNYNNSIVQWFRDHGM